MKNLRLLIGDPGKSNDPFGVVGLQATHPEKKIYIRHAKQFIKEKYDTVAKHLIALQDTVKPHMILIEKNFDYENVQKTFVKYPFSNLQYITTSSGLTEETRRKGWTVDKPFMIGWLRDQQKDHVVQYPKVQTADMKELINQQQQMVGVTLSSGHVSYKALRNRHDDLFMAKLIGCNAIRIWWDENDKKL